MDPVLTAVLAIATLGVLTVAARKRASSINALMRPANRQAWGDLYAMVGHYSTSLVAPSERWPGSFAALAPFNGMIQDVLGSDVYIVRFTAEPETYVIRNARPIADLHVGRVVFPGDEVCPIATDVLHFDVYYATDAPSRLPESLRETEPLAWAQAHGVSISLEGN